MENSAVNTLTPQQTPLGPNAGPQAWRAELVTWLPIIAGRVVTGFNRMTLACPIRIVGTTAFEDESARPILGTAAFKHVPQH
jgi:hypothetical protein